MHAYLRISRVKSSRRASSPETKTLKGKHGDDFRHFFLYFKGTLCVLYATRLNAEGHGAICNRKYPFFFRESFLRCPRTTKERQKEGSSRDFPSRDIVSVIFLAINAKQLAAIESESSSESHEPILSRGLRRQRDRLGAFNLRLELSKERDAMIFVTRDLEFRASRRL